VLSAGAVKRWRMPAFSVANASEVIFAWWFMVKLYVKLSYDSPETAVSFVIRLWCADEFLFI
jgi:hypothetical protein